MFCKRPVVLDSFLPVNLEKRNSYSHQHLFLVLMTTFTAVATLFLALRMYTDILGKEPEGRLTCFYAFIGTSGICGLSILAHISQYYYSSLKL